MSNATESPAASLVGPLSLVPLLVSIGTFILVVIMMCYVYHRREVRKSVQFSKQLRVTEERIENLEARKVMKLTRREQHAQENKSNLIEMENLRPERLGGKEMSASRKLLNESVDRVDRHVGTTELALQEDTDMSTAAECGTTCSAGSLSTLRAETSAGMFERWRRQRQGATVTPLLVTATVQDARRGVGAKTRVETSPPVEQGATFTAARNEAIHHIATGNGATASSLTDTCEKWV